MKKKFITLTFMIMSELGFSNPRLDPTFDVFDVGNGGDIAYCKVGTKTNLFTLDYFFMTLIKQKQELFYNGKFVPNLQGSSFIKSFDYDQVELSSNQTVTRHLFDLNALKPYANAIELNILSNLKKHVPELAKDYEQFLFYKLNFIEEAPMVWVSRVKLPNITDEQASHLLLQKKCDQFSQAIVRVKKNDKLYYFYETSNMMIAQMDPMQESFLFVHEWLWNHLGSASSIRKANWFLHSKESQKMSQGQFRAKLKELGFLR